ncbi:Gfo/Idh/MocA family protein [Testudinibacter aquarius]|uniref:Gfo/Idh/MocA family oxidoreductase n=1 Tax=Testudinibacter aquarius TaxID=1524974 RepID=A0A4R3YAW6_9PAST|nr:Gfo/Idh/MocA family oxidoreductase [Testudinibacter aquarius]KAE9528311.1 oxidoreductase [Testudinibacter aquarius]TCV88851.1 putative dehydrogenase [Testudinibacter aquarius]TNG93419.1 Gfo/Idh/MocA family oxidoreductase [Testudinibacter aquarius]
MNSIKVALIGCGFFGQQLAYGFQKNGAELVGVQDINHQQAVDLATSLNTVAYLDVADMLQQSKPDLVLIATYNYAHRQVAEQALQVGCAVFIETPFATEAEDCQQILTLAAQNDKPVFIGHVLRALPGLLKAKQLIEQQALGRITVARANRQRWIDSARDKNWWKNDIKLTGGKLLHEIHELDLLCWLLGEVDSVYAQSTNRAHSDTPDNHDIIQLLLQFKNGVFGSLEMGTAYRLHEWGISIHGELGSLVVNFFTSTLTLSFADGRRQQFNLYDEFEADLSLRENGKSTQKYNQINELCPFWLSRAVEIEALSVLQHLQGQQRSVLHDSPARAVCVAVAAKRSIQEKVLIKVQYN